MKRNMTESKISMSSTILCLSCWSEKQDGRPGLWLAETFSTSSLKPLNGIQWNLTGSTISTSSTKFVFFGPVRKKMAVLASDSLRHCRLLLWKSGTEFNDTWQEARSQCLLPSFCCSGQLEWQSCHLISKEIKFETEELIVLGWAIVGVGPLVHIHVIVL